MKDDGAYLWERCYACGHRLRFASTACPQCGIGFDGRAEPETWPTTCTCERCAAAKPSQPSDPTQGSIEGLTKALGWAMRHLRGCVSFGDNGDAFERGSGRELVGFMPRWDKAEAVLKAALAASAGVRQHPKEEEQAQTRVDSLPSGAQGSNDRGER